MEEKKRKWQDLTHDEIMRKIDTNRDLIHRSLESGLDLSFIYAKITKCTDINKELTEELEFRRK